MNESPCKRCPRGETCQDGELCRKWETWFRQEWRNMQEQLGVIPPEGRKTGRPVKYIYEVRKERTGEVICRGTAAEVAQTTGMGMKTVRAAAAGTVKGMYRMTKLEVGERQENAEHEHDGDDAGGNI